MTTDFGDGDDRATGVAVQNDGRIVVSGIDPFGRQRHTWTARRISPWHVTTRTGRPTTASARARSPAGAVTTDFSGLGFSSEIGGGHDGGRQRPADRGRARQPSPLPPGEGQGEGYSSFAVSCYDPGAAACGSRSAMFRPCSSVFGNQDDCDRTSAGPVAHWAASCTGRSTRGTSPTGGLGRRLDPGHRDRHHR